VRSGGDGGSEGRGSWCVVRVIVEALRRGRNLFPSRGLKGWTGAD
jgi:hypothetical protein